MAATAVGGSMLGILVVGISVAFVLALLSEYVLS